MSFCLGLHKESKTAFSIATIMPEAVCLLLFCFLIALLGSSILKLKTKPKKLVFTHFVCSTYELGELLSSLGPQKVLLEPGRGPLLPLSLGCWEKHFKWGVQDVPHLRTWLLSTGLKEVRELWIWGYSGVGRTFQAERRTRKKGPKAQQQGLPVAERQWLRGQGVELRPNVLNSCEGVSRMGNWNHSCLTCLPLWRKGKFKTAGLKHERKRKKRRKAF